LLFQKFADLKNIWYNIFNLVNNTIRMSEKLPPTPSPEAETPVENQLVWISELKNKLEQLANANLDPVWKEKAQVLLKQLNQELDVVIAGTQGKLDPLQTEVVAEKSPNTEIWSEKNVSNPPPAQPPSSSV